MISFCFIASVFFAVQDADTSSTRQWRTPSEIVQQLDTLSTTNESVSMTTIGFSKNGTRIQCLQVSRVSDVPVKNRSAILVVAGIDGDHLLGSEVAVDIIEELLSRDSEETKFLLEDHYVIVIPQVNPDASEFFFAPVLHGQRRNMRATDNDHDGLFDEDGNEDLNGDGFITMMRVPDLEKATHTADPDNPRIDIKPDALKEQAAQYVLYSEGIDNDGDGQYNEDGIGGVDLNKNFMHGYQYHGDGAGPWQLSESESKALAVYVLDHQEIAAIVVYGQHDTLSKTMGEGGKDQAGAPKKLAAGDVELYKLVSERFQELVPLKNTTQPNWDGSFVAWAYAQYGVPAFSTPLWARPEPIKEEEAKDDATTESPDTTTETESTETDNDAANMKEVSPKHMATSSGVHGSTDEETEDTADSDDSSLTPSSVGDISQETLDELFQAAEAAGFPVTDEMMEEITPQEVEQYAKMSGVKVRRIKSKKGNGKSSSDEVAWLEYSDTQRNGEGFVEWTSFEHPQLGTVEIGGWVPYFKTLPPTDVIEDTTKTQADFLIDLASKLPDVHIGSPIVEKLGNGLWEIRIAVTNDGWFPSGTAMAKKNKRARPYVIRLEVPNDTIVSGQKVNRIWALAGSGTQKWYKWILQGKPNSTVSITLYSEKFGSETISTSLKNTAGGDS